MACSLQSRPQLCNSRFGLNRGAQPHQEFTSEIKLRARPDEIAQGEEEPEKQRERELEKWREEHKAQLERE